MGYPKMGKGDHDVCDELNRLCRRYGLSKSSLARIAQLDRSYTTDMLNHKQTPGAETIAKVAVAFESLDPNNVVAQDLAGMLCLMKAELWYEKEEEDG